VAKLALGVESRPDEALQVVHREVDLPVEPLPPPSELETARKQSATEAARRRKAGAPYRDVAEAEIQRDWASEALQAWEKGPLQTSRRCEMQGLRLGDAAILALPLEVFVETGLAIKQAGLAAGASVTIVSSNSNGALGYLPTQDAYDTEGDYTNPQGVAPKVYDLYAFSPQAEPTIRQQADQLIRTLYRESPRKEGASP
jgi:hypothetical protein